MSIISDVIDSTRAIIQGMSVTLSYIPKPKQTVEYPDESVTMQPRYRGQHLLHVDENGKEKCVACFLCAAACPSECIYIEAGEYPDNSVEKFPIRYDIDTLRCIYCGYCVEACPCDAIRMDSGTIRESGRSAQGVRLLHMEPGDRVAAAVVIPPDEEPNGGLLQ